jgi:aspartyl/asparaginyl beta-hydroxylase (cupin superfamily)
MPKLWFARKGEIYEEKGTLPFYPNLDEKWYNNLEPKIDNFHSEALNLIQNIDDFLPYFEDDIQQPKNTWKTLGLLRWGLANKSKLKTIPILHAYIQNHPEIVGCFISKIEAQAKIKEHSGMTNANYRCHLGLIVPSENPDVLGIQVKNHTAGWAEKKLLVFIDANKHHAWNKTNEDRYVMIFDVIRPEFLAKKTFVLSRIFVMATLAILANKLQLSNIYQTPNFLINSLAFLLKPLTRFILHLKKV